MKKLRLTLLILMSSGVMTTRPDQAQKALRALGDPGAMATRFGMSKDDLLSYLREKGFTNSLSQRAQLKKMNASFDQMVIDITTPGPDGKTFLDASGKSDAKALIKSYIEDGSMPLDSLLTPPTGDDLAGMLRTEDISEDAADDEAIMNLTLKFRTQSLFERVRIQEGIQNIVEFASKNGGDEETAKSDLLDDLHNALKDGTFDSITARFTQGFSNTTTVSMLTGFDEDQLEGLSAQELTNVSHSYNSAISHLSEKTGLDLDSVRSMVQDAIKNNNLNPNDLNSGNLFDAVDAIADAVAKPVQTARTSFVHFDTEYDIPQLTNVVKILNANAELQGKNPAEYIADNLGDTIFAEYKGSTRLSKGKSNTGITPTEFDTILDTVGIDKNEFLQKYIESRINAYDNGTTGYASTGEARDATHKATFIQDELDKLQSNGFATSDDIEVITKALPVDDRPAADAPTGSGLKGLTERAQTTVANARRIDIPQTELVEYSTELKALDAQGAKLTVTLDDLANTSENPLFEMINNNEALRDATDPVTFESEGNKYKYDPPTNDNPEGSLEMLGE